MLLTRATPEQAAAAIEAVPGARFHETARLVVVKAADRPVDATVAVVAAGTSDLPVAEEAAVTVEATGATVDRITDVGVAGVHRILEHRATLEAADCVIVVAGMEGALPSVVAGLISTPIVAVPTSVGYGASFEGLSALLTMLASCAPGVAVVNIDNGLGAAPVAHRIVRANSQGRRMRLLYFDCIAGISGDMALGALIDAGADLEPIRKGLEGLPPSSPFELDVSNRWRAEGSARPKVNVRTSTDGLIRTYASVRSLLDMAEMPLDAKAMAQRIFRRLAEAEAMVHRRDLDQVTFHEVGAVDSIVDIVGTSLALASLKVDRVFASAVPTGMGMVKTEHGLLPIPAPAVMELLRGAPIYSRNVSVELVTPTGAAILAALVEGFGEIPLMRIERVGYGAGSARLDFPNVVRVVVGEADPSANAAAETAPGTSSCSRRTWTTSTPRLYAYVLEAPCSRPAPRTRGSPRS